LVAACAFFCHRFYGIFLPFDPDVAQNIYWELHRPLVLRDHNPFHWYYHSYLPMARAFNPLMVLMRTVVETLAPSASPITQALAVMMTTSFLCLSALALSIYGLFRYLGRKPVSAGVGALVVSFTGFHISSGVRQFDQFYLFSFAAVAPTIICIEKTLLRRRPLPWIALGAMAVGFSLLGGSNVPLFFYLPLAFALPWIHYYRERDLQWSLQKTGWLVAMMGLGVLAGAATLLPGWIYLPETNRAQLSFFDRGFSTTFLERILSLFHRDWWVDRKIPDSAIDFYLGLPVLALLVIGISRIKFDLKKKKTLPLIFIWMLLCLSLGTVVTSYPSLPGFLQSPIRVLYEALTIRHPHRFFMLCLIPIGYLVARGLEVSVSAKQRVIIVITTLFYLGSGAIFVIPNWDTLIPDVRWAAMLSQPFAILATVLLFFAGSNVINKKAIGAGFAFCIYAMYLLAPIQMTCFSSTYFKDPATPASLFPERLQLPNLLGLSARYGTMVTDVARLMTVPPPGLRSPETRVGKVLEDIRPDQRTLSYYAPVSGHQFTFTNIEDPASPRRMRELAQELTEPVLDMAGVCWSPAQTSYARRKSCLPSQFIVPSAKLFLDDGELLQWVRKASHVDFQKFVAINCKDFSCAGMPSDDREKFVSSLKVVKETPGSLRYLAESSTPSFLFLSIPYRFDWIARVNGKRATAVRANYAFMAIPLPAGESSIELELDDAITRYASAISIFVFLGLTGAWYRSNRKQRSKHA